MTIKLLYIVIGGGIGSLLRYLISGLVQRQSTGLFPIGTFTVNLIGALIIGFLWELFQNIAISTNIRVFIFMGLLGGFTTFSTFTLETFNLIKNKEYIQALINVTVSNISCLIFVFLGSASAKLLIKFLKR
ncbi:MAG: fluoride efflux transporter CrcB [Candidatus Humimicrobiaceae bacterium]